MALLIVIGACSDDDAVTTTTAPAPVATTTAATVASTTSTSPTATTTIASTTTTAPPAPTTTSAPPTTTSTSTTTIPAQTSTTSANQPPVATITAPPNLSSHEAKWNADLGDFAANVTLTAIIGDADDTDLDIQWFSSDQGLLGTGNQLDVSLGTDFRDTAQPFITVVVTDPAGNRTEHKIQLILWVPSDE